MRNPALALARFVVHPQIWCERRRSQNLNQSFFGFRGGTARRWRDEPQNAATRFVASHSRAEWERETDLRIQRRRRSKRLHRPGASRLPICDCCAASKRPPSTPWWCSPGWRLRCCPSRDRTRSARLWGRCCRLGVSTIPASRRRLSRNISRKAPPTNRGRGSRPPPTSTDSRESTLARTRRELDDAGQPPRSSVVGASLNADDEIGSICCTFETKPIHAPRGGAIYTPRWERSTDHEALRRGPAGWWRARAPSAPISWRMEVWEISGYSPASAPAAQASASAVLRRAYTTGAVRNRARRQSTRRKPSALKNTSKPPRAAAGESRCFSGAAVSR